MASGGGDVCFPCPFAWPAGRFRAARNATLVPRGTEATVLTIGKAARFT